MKKIILIEDDRALSNGICLALRTNEIQIEPCFSLRSADSKMNQNTYDLIILDLNMPDGNGLDLLRKLRINGTTPVVILTANDMETDIVAGLELGADDYITKPFSLAVLRARVNTQLRKAIQAPPCRLEIDDYLFDFDRMAFYKNGVQVDLSKTEQKLLRCLVENRGITLSREKLVDRIWTDGSEYVDENALSVTIKRLRNKLETVPARPDYIKTVYGIGYTWAVKGQ